MLLITGPLPPWNHRTAAVAFESGAGVVAHLLSEAARRKHYRLSDANIAPGREMKTMPDACDSPLGAQPSRAYGSAAGDCAIFTKETPKQCGPKIVQVIESISYHPSDRTVRILFDIVTRHTGKEPVRFRLVHRGRTEASLHRLPAGAEDPRQEVLNGLYVDRIKFDEAKPNTMLLHQRNNGVGYQPEPIEVSLSGPGAIFDKTAGPITLKAEIESEEADPMFMSYIIPPDPLAIQPGETAVCRVELALVGKSYERFVEDPPSFSVECDSRLMADMEAFELDRSEGKLRELYIKNIQPKNCILSPQAYDVVVFQGVGGCARVSLQRSSFGYTPGPVPSAELAKRAVWCFGDPGFYLEFLYAERPSGVIVTNAGATGRESGQLS